MVVYTDGFALVDAFNVYMDVEVWLHVLDPEYTV